MHKLIVALLLLVVALPAAFTLAQDDVPYFETDVCPFLLPEGEVEGETVTCGWLVVEENRSDPDTYLIDLRVAVLHSTGANPAPDPIVYLEGGPGGSALAGVDLWWDSPFRDRREVVLIDQRGTGWSLPSLDCWELWEYDDPVEASEACYERLISDDIDLSAYNSAENAADIADLAVALGYDSYNIYGVSYGSRLALTVLRDYPEGIRSMIIDGVYPPVVAGYDEQAPNAQRAFEELFATCAADSACNSAYPNLRETFFAAVDLLNDNPLEVIDPITEEVLYEEYTGEDFVNEVFDLMYDTTAIPYLPAFIHGAAQRDVSVYFDIGAEYEGEFDDEGFEDAVMDYFEFEDYRELEDFFNNLSDDEYFELEDDFIVMQALGYDSYEELYDYLDALPDDEYVAVYDTVFGIDDDAEGMFAAVTCREEVPFNSLDNAETLTQGIPLQIAAPMLLSVEDQFVECEIWEVGRADAIEAAAVVSDVPVLAVSGQFDPITPPEWGEVAVESLPNGTHLEFPGVGHAVIDAGACPLSVGLAFLEDPTAPLDTSCVEQMGVQFEIR